MKASGLAVIVLGGAHALSDNHPANVKLVELMVKSVSDAENRSECIQ